MSADTLSIQQAKNVSVNEQIQLSMLLSAAITECQAVAKGGYRPLYVRMSSPMSVDNATGELGCNP